MTTEIEMIREALQSQQTSGEGLQASILYNQNIDLQLAKEITTCYVNDDWALTIKELIGNGWKLFRMQTEFGINGHYTKAYFAKF